MTDHPIHPRTVEALRALDGQSVTLRTHELVEDVDGAPAGVSARTWEPALLVVPWGRFGFPDRPDTDGPAAA